MKITSIKYLNNIPNKSENTIIIKEIIETDDNLNSENTEEILKEIKKDCVEDFVWGNAVNDGELITKEKFISKSNQTLCNKDNPFIIDQNKFIPSKSKKNQ